jgi:azurin
MKIKTINCVYIIILIFSLTNYHIENSVDIYTKTTNLSTYTDTTLVEIKTVGIDLTYDITEIEVKAGSVLTIRYDNSESDMAHNIVVLRSDDDIHPVGMASFQAHANEWIPEDEIDRIIAYSKLAFPGDIIEFTFIVPPPGTYPFICTYSGHFTMMQGRLTSIE